MTSTDTSATASNVATGLDAFFANIKNEWEILEQDVITVIQNIGAGVEMAAEDIQQCLSWLGSHIGAVSTTVSAVQSAVAALGTAGVTIPPSLTNGIAEMNQAVAGVNQALSNQALAANPTSALADGYNATKALQAAAAGAAAVAASIQAATAPAPAAS